MDYNSTAAQTSISKITVKLNQQLCKNSLKNQMNILTFMNAGFIAGHCAGLH